MVKRLFFLVELTVTSNSIFCRYAVWFVAKNSFVRIHHVACFQVGRSTSGNDACFSIGSNKCNSSSSLDRKNVVLVPEKHHPFICQLPRKGTSLRGIYSPLDAVTKNYLWRDIGELLGKSELVLTPGSGLCTKRPKPHT